MDFATMVPQSCFHSVTHRTNSAAAHPHSSCSRLEPRWCVMMTALTLTSMFLLYMQFLVGKDGQTVKRCVLSSNHLLPPVMNLACSFARLQACQPLTSDAGMPSTDKECYCSILQVRHTHQPNVAHPRDREAAAGGLSLAAAAVAVEERKSWFEPYLYAFCCTTQGCPCCSFRVAYTITIQ